MQPDLILVHGLFASRDGLAQDHASRAPAVTRHAQAMGICAYEWVSGRRKAMANRILQSARGTVRAVDALEIIELNEATTLNSLRQKATRLRWREILACAPYGIVADRSFVLAGQPVHLLEGPAKGQRVLWFGNGLSQLSEAEFIAHYTGHHGPLVASYAQVLGLGSYRQVPNEQGELCDSLRELGLGQAVAPAVFAELIMGIPPLNLASLRARRIANREIAADEKRHISFDRSMLLLA